VRLNASDEWLYLTLRVQFPNTFTTSSIADMITVTTQKRHRTLQWTHLVVYNATDLMVPISYGLSSPPHWPNFCSAYLLNPLNHADEMLNPSDPHLPSSPLLSNAPPHVSESLCGFLLWSMSSDHFILVFRIPSSPSLMVPLFTMRSPFVCIYKTLHALVLPFSSPVPSLLKLHWARVAISLQHLNFLN